MSDKNYVFTKYCRFQQQMVLLFSGFIMLIGSLSLLFNRGYSAWTTLGIVLIGSIGVNLLGATLYKIRKEGNNVVIENMWRDKTYPVEALVEIRLLKFVIPYPFNPFVKFSFNDGKSFTGSIPNPLFVYLRRGGIRRYLKDVCEEWSA
jgi:hypothetical protein